MRGKKVPIADRARAVGIAAVSSIAEASRQTGIPEPTINAWYHAPEFEELRGRNNTVRNQEWEVGVQLAFRKAVALLERTEDPVKAATAGAIIFDKLALATGQATARSEVSTFNGRNDHERSAIASLLREAIATGGEPGLDEGVPGDVPVGGSGQG